MERKQGLQIDPSPFSGDFKTKMNEVVNDEVGKVIKYGGQTVAAAIPMVLLKGQTSEDNDNIVLNKRHVWGFGAGMACALEEAFEKDPDRNAGRKIVSIAAKFGAGYTAGFLISSNVENYGWSPEKWIQEVEGVSRIIMLSAPAYVLYKETSITNFGNGLATAGQGLVDKLKGLRQVGKEKREQKKQENEQKKQKEKEDKEFKNTLIDFYNGRGSERRKAREALIGQGFMCTEDDVRKDLGNEYEVYTIQNGKVEIVKNYKGIFDRAAGAVLNKTSSNNKPRR